jgi:hypothetical protein
MTELRDIMKTIISLSLLALLVLLSSGNCFGDSDSGSNFVLLPESRDQQYRTFGLFIDNQTSGLFLPSGNDVWLALGEEVALLENKSWYGSPQLVLYASVNAGDRLKTGSSTILMETIDIRAGLSYEFSIDEKQRIAVTYMHQSGHTSDDVQDETLVHPNLGNEELLVRYFRDIQDRFRLGGTLKPYFGSDPGIERFAADQFFEWFPWGTAARMDKFTPFIAGSVEEYGAQAINVTYHAQLGAYIGNHMQPIYKPNVRVVAGYYNGVDPRLKYAQFDFGFQRFYYFGAQLGL